MEISILCKLLSGKWISKYSNIVACFLKWNVKGVFSVKIIALILFIVSLSFVENVIFHPQIKYLVTGNLSICLLMF